MATVHDDDEVGFEEGMLLLPSHVLDEACGTKVSTRNHHPNHKKSSGESQSQYSKCPSSRSSSYQRPKLANGGPGMRAIFLESRHGSSGGTGVFLPQRVGANFQPNKRPACAPVLLPARVVQALNLNVHALGVQISPSQVEKYKPRRGEGNINKSTEKENGQKDASSKQCSFVSQNQSSSQEIFLPKEWTY